MPTTEKVRQTRWRKFKRSFSEGRQQNRYGCEVIFAPGQKSTYWQVTTEPKTLPANSTSYVMTNISGLNYQDIGNIYGERTWIEYGFRQCQSELGWSDFHLTKYPDIAKWWEVVSCTFLLVSLHAIPQDSSGQLSLSTCELELKNYLAEHPDWEHHQGWKSMLNTMQLLLLPVLAFNLVKPWFYNFYQSPVS